MTASSFLPFFSRSNARNKAGVCSANFLYSARSRMDALQKVVERKSTTKRNDNFAVKNEAFFPDCQCGSDNFRKIAAQILPGFGIHGHRFVVSRQKATKAIPFRFVLPLSPVGIASTERASIASQNVRLFFTLLFAFDRDVPRRAFYLYDAPAFAAKALFQGIHQIDDITLFCLFFWRFDCFACGLPLNKRL